MDNRRLMEACLWLRLAFVGLVLWTHDPIEVRLWLAGADALFGTVALIQWGMSIYRQRMVIRTT